MASDRPGRIQTDTLRRCELFETIRERNKWYFETYPQRRAERIKRNHASYLVNQAIAKGDLTRQPCEVCGEPKAEGHHTDYDKPLIVVWLCKKHHVEEHVKLRKKQKKTRKSAKKINTSNLPKTKYICSACGEYKFKSENKQWMKYWCKKTLKYTRLQRLPYQ